MSNSDIFEGKWKQMKGKVQSKWGKLTDDEVDQVEGDSQKLEGLLQERYGMAREEAKKQIRAMADSC